MDSTRLRVKRDRGQWHVLENGSVRGRYPTRPEALAAARRKARERERVELQVQTHTGAWRQIPSL